MRLPIGPWTLACLWVGLSGFAVGSRTILAQETAASSGEADSAQGRVTFEAFSGEPFGVACVRVHSPADAWQGTGRDPFLEVAGKTVTPLYPVFSIRETALEQEAGGERRLPEAVEVRFLFSGKEPFEASLWDGHDGHSLTIVPRDDGARHTALLDEWWRSKVAELVAIRRSPSRIPLVDNYVVVTLGRRLGRTVPKILAPWNGSLGSDDLLGSLLGTEEVRLAMQSERLLRTDGPAAAADQPLPTPVLPPAVTIPKFEAPEIESLARFVPEECFYVRFGSFSNYRWTRETMTRWGGNLQNLIATRGIDYDIRAGLERQLVLPETALGDLVGELAIADMALIGMDPFVREGAAIGMLFEARKGPVLGAAIAGLRTAARAQDSSIGEQTLEIAGRKVSLLSTPDNRVRSFYVAEGDRHLVTTSREIVRRFLEGADGTRTLAGLKEFQYARSQFPAPAPSAVFVYLSDPWFRQLVGPRYRVEMTRRMQADADLELVALAQLAARLEKKPAGTLDDLIRNGFLPDSIRRRPDDSQPNLVAGAPPGEAGAAGLLTAVDSLRGGRRTFLPIPDVEIRGLTSAEVEAYEKFAEFYQQIYTRMDPVVLAVQRTPLGDGEGKGEGAGREKILLELAVTPYTRQGLGGAEQFLGPQVDDAIAPVPGDVASLQVQVRGFFGDAKTGKVYAGLRDQSVPFTVEGDFVRPVLLLPDVAFYLGGRWGGILQGLHGQDDFHVRDEAGYGSLERRFGAEDRIWFRRQGDLLTMAFQKSLLEEVTPNVKLLEGARPAQIRLRIADLAGTRIEKFVRAQFFLQEVAAGRANEALLDRVSQQLGVPKPDGLRAVQQILQGSPLCPFGGMYALEKSPAYRDELRPPSWRSTKRTSEREYASWGDPNRGVPERYVSRLLKWFHGLELEFRLVGQTLHSRTEIEVSTQD